jgi:DNA polymerase (family 10)
MTNADVARVFAEVADLLEISGAEGFRVNAYRKVARTIEDLAVDINDVAARGGLADLAGVGKSSAEKIHELLTTGKLRQREELTAAVPETLLDLLQIQGVGPKKVALLWRERNIRSLDDLRAALAAGTLAGLKGFGDKSLAQLQQGLDFLARSAGRRRLGTAWNVAETLRHAVAALPGVTRVAHAGSLRRGCETVGDLDLLCCADDGAAVVRAFTGLPDVAQVLAAGDTKGSILYEYRPRRTIQVDLRVVPAESFGAAWQYFTGSKEHNVRLRERAQQRGWTLNEYGLYEDERVIAGREEGDIYAALGLPYYPPELREDRFEFTLDAVPDDLLVPDHIRGDLHMHTIASDGVNTVEEMVRGALERGYAYVCITDHSQSSVIANGLDVDRLRAHVAEVRRVAAEHPEITVWAGAEVDILAAGRLDYPDDVLAELDFVVASIHAGMGQDAAANTRRTLAAIRNPYVNAIGHPTGRLINSRDAMPLDMEAVCRAAAETGTALEINASFQRLDLKDQHARLAKESGALLVINTDAHAIDQFDQMRFGVVTARRAGLLRDDVLNTRSPEAVRAFVERKRRG